jgi:hypothetical protein
VAAWLLDRQQTLVQTPGKKKKRNADMAGSYSIAATTSTWRLMTR